MLDDELGTTPDAWASQTAYSEPGAHRAALAAVPPEPEAIHRAVTGLVAQFLVSLIAIVTNVAFYGRLSNRFVSPAHHHLGWLVLFVPAIGGIVVGLMARFGSKAIRGHGIPEAMEQVLLNESRIPARMTFLKPLSAAIAIGTGFVGLGLLRPVGDVVFRGLMQVAAYAFVAFLAVSTLGYLLSFMQRLPRPQLVVPGNHDICLYNLIRRFFLPLNRYREHICSDLRPVYRDDKLLVIGINSARPFTWHWRGFWKDGEISAEQLLDVENRGFGNRREGRTAGRAELELSLQRHGIVPVRAELDARQHAHVLDRYVDPLSPRGNRDLTTLEAYCEVSVRVLREHPLVDVGDGLAPAVQKLHGVVATSDPGH